MAGALIHVELSNAAEVQEILGRLYAFDHGALFEEIGALVESQTRRRITDEKESPLGVPWAPWSKSYAKAQKKRIGDGDTGGAPSLLEREGLLLASMSYQAAGDQVTVGSNREYAATHQFGDYRLVTVREFKRTIYHHFGEPYPAGIEQTVARHHALRNIPARPFLGLSYDNEDEIEDLARDYFLELIGDG